MDKPAGPTARRRRKKHRAVKALENANKEQVRKRDGLCRFPLCGCRRFGYFLAVAHRVHKGMGGDPTGERSQPEGMILVCSPRHREHEIAIDKGAIRWRPLTVDGANGPIAWDIALIVTWRIWADTVGTRDYIGDPMWIELAREIDIRHWEPFTEWQHETLRRLAEMDL